MSAETKGARRRGPEPKDPAPIERDEAAQSTAEPTAAGTSPALTPKADSAPEHTLSAKTPHNYAFETKFVPSILSSNSTEQNFRGLFHLGALCSRSFLTRLSYYFLYIY